MFKGIDRTKLKTTYTDESLRRNDPKTEEESRFTVEFGSKRSRDRSPRHEQGSPSPVLP